MFVPYVRHPSPNFWNLSEAASEIKIGFMGTHLKGFLRLFSNLSEARVLDEGSWSSSKVYAPLFCLFLRPLWVIGLLFRLHEQGHDEKGDDGPPAKPR